jgi:hypothetical protein
MIFTALKFNGSFGFVKREYSSFKRTSLRGQFHKENCLGELRFELPGKIPAFKKGAEDCREALPASTS